MSSWQTKSSKVVYENPWIIVHEDKVVMPNGKDGLYGYIDATSDSVYIVPVDDQGHTYLIQQERYTTKKKLWEVPAGKTDGEPYELAAKRELLEETGLRAKEIKVLSEVQAAASTTTFKGAVCVATGLTQITEQLDASEGILAKKKILLQDAVAMIMRQEIINSPSITALLMTQEYLRNKDQHPDNSTKESDKL